MPEPMSTDQLAAIAGNYARPEQIIAAPPALVLRLAETALAALKRADEAEAKVQRVRDLVDEARQHWQPEHRSISIIEVDAAIDNWDNSPAPEQPAHHTNDCDLLIRNRACSCGYAPDPFGRSADQ